MKCVECKYWQGQFSEWGDCNRVIAVLQPGLLEVKRYVDEDVWYYFDIPFDPHHVKYWNYNIDFSILYAKAAHMELPEGVRREIIKEQDIWIDQFGKERTKLVNVCYFMTHKTFNCEYGERDERRTD
jgi:hypothetical protein